MYEAVSSEEACSTDSGGGKSKSKLPYHDGSFDILKAPGLLEAVKAFPAELRELVPFVLDLDKLTCSAKEFIAAVQAEGAAAYSGVWPEMYKEEAFAKQKGFGSRH